MVKTGDNIFNVLSIIALTLPLAPLLIVFIRRATHHALLNLLRVICLIAFFRQLVQYIPGLLQKDASFAGTAFELGEFILFYYLFKLSITQKRVRDVMNILLVSFISIVITIYILKGLESFPVSIALVQSGILILLAVISLLQMIGDKTLILFREPLFWIAGGVLCYSGMFLFMETLLNYYPYLTANVQQEKAMVLSATDIFRFLFFIVAAMVAKSREPIAGSR